MWRRRRRACRSIPSTVSCFEETAPDLADTGLGEEALVTIVDLLVPRFLIDDPVAGDRLLTRFADFGLALLVAIWLSLVQRQHHVLSLTQAPRSGGARRSGQGA
jgi:hypothetical protein